MDVGCAYLQDTHHRRRSLQERPHQHQRCTSQSCPHGKAGRHHTSAHITYSFKVLQAIEKRVGAKLVAEMMENVTTPDQYELLEMSRVSGFVNRAKGTGRPTKKDRRSLEEFTAPEFMDDFDFEFDFEEED